jgi:hypothetical protein
MYLSVTVKCDDRAEETAAVFNPSRQVVKEGENKVLYYFLMITQRNVLI